MKTVKSIEKCNKLSKRWRPGEAQFNAAALCLENQRRETVVEQTYNMAVERVFLISLKRKYAGNVVDRNRRDRLVCHYLNL
jgi:hypothetical protein